MIEIKQIMDIKLIEDVLKDFNDVFPNLVNRISLREYSKKILINGKMFVAFVDNNLAGLICFYDNDFDNKTAFITLIGVKEKYRRLKLGTEMLKLCNNEALKNGMESVRLEVRNYRTDAIRFYIKNGFEIYSINDNFSYMKKILR